MISLHTFSRWRTEILIFLDLSLALLTLQLYFLLYSDILSPYFIFRLDPLYLPSVYLSNLVNNSWLSFADNIIILWIGLLLVFSSDQSRERFRITMLLIFLFFPFLLSLLNVPLLVYTGSGSLGFSGIAVLVLGYGFYSSLTRVVKVSKFRGMGTPIFVFVLFLVPLLSLIFFASPLEPDLILQYGFIEGIFQTFLQTKINIYIHVVAYALGFVLGYVTDQKREVIKSSTV